MRHAFIATPVHNGMLHVAYVQSFMQTAGLLSQNGVAFTHSFLIGNSLVHDARNRLITDFINREDATDLLFIDADIGWAPEDALRLIQSPHDVIGGAYPQKREDVVRFNVGLKRDAVQTTSLLEVDFLGTGFLKISKRAAKKLVKGHPEWVYGDGNGGKVYALFDTCMSAGKIEGEDVVFCRRWQEAGGRVFLDPNMTLVHVGEKAYRGNFSELIARAREAA